LKITFCSIEQELLYLYSPKFFHMNFFTKLFFSLGLFLLVQSLQSQNTCGSPFVIPGIPFASGTQTTCGTVNDYAAGFAPCVSSSYGGGEDYVYQLDVTAAPITYQFVLGGAATWKILSLHSACPPASANCLGGVANSAGNGSFNYSFTTNGTYYLIVDTWPSPACGEFTLSIGIPPPPPSNDLCAGAIPFPTIPSDGSCANMIVNTANATGTADGTCTGTEDDDVWYSFTVPVGVTSLLYTNTTITGNGDRVLQILSGSCPGTSIGCYDPESGTITGLTGGQTYLLRAYTWSTGVVSNFNICLRVVPPPPVNDLCASALPITCGQTIAGSTVSSTIDAVGTCTTTLGTAGGVWYSYVGNGGTATMSLCGSSFDTKLAVFTGSCAALTCVIGSDDFCGTQSQVSFPTTIGTTYLVLVTGFSTNTGAFTLAATSTAPANDLCANAVPVACGSTVTGSTRCANVDGPGTSCNGLSVGPDVWYTIVGNGTPITASLCGSTYDTKLEIYSGTCGALVCVANNDDFCSTQSEVQWTASTAVTYYIRVHGFNGASGEFTLTMTCAAPPPSCLALPTSPTNGQSGICPSATTVLSWPASLGATSYDVYFGTTATPPFVGTTANTTFTVNTPSAGTYFWQIRPSNANGTASGCVVWSFTKATGAFTPPANTAATVACPSQIVAPPTPPAVTTNCGSTVTPTGPVITNNPNPITCEGTRTYVWTYNNGFGQVSTYTHTVTVERNPFGVPASGGSTVTCPNQTDAPPAAPVVTSNCGEVLTPVVTSSVKPFCEGSRTWSFTYTDCEGNVATWLYIYTIEYQDFTIPASETETVECPLVAMEPTPPTATDNCGNTVTPTGPVITSTNNASGCEGARKYAWTYTDCEGNTHEWSKTFNFEYTADFFTYPDGEDYVACLAYAQAPVFPPTIYGICGEELKVSQPIITESVDASGCSGTRKYTFIYTDCGGHSHPWSFTIIANDTEPPVGSCVSGSLNSVDVTNLSCIADVPCPGDYDFGPKIQEMLASGNIYDVCSGSDLNVELDSWSQLWQCNADAGGTPTFGRTFYFRISDQCGNEMPSLCEVTYSGACQPLETFTQAEWGNEGGEPGLSTPNAASDVQTIQNLLGMGPIMIGGANRSITFTDAQCIMSAVPGVGNPGILSNCQQTNCVGCNPAGPIGMKNILATNTVALMLNMRFNVQYHGLTMPNVRNQGLGCITIDPTIKFCVEGAGCKLRVFETNGTAHEFPYTLGGLYDLANLYLNGALVLSTGNSLVYAAAINNSISNVNNYWHNGQIATTCDQAAGMPFASNDSVDKVVKTGKPQIANGEAFTVAPNPASSEVTFKLAEMKDAQDVKFEIYNQLGQLVLSKNFGNVTFVNESIDLSSIGTGLYLVSVKAGSERYEQKLVIGK